GAVTIEIAEAGFGNADGPATDLAWGLVVDTDGASVGSSFETDFLATAQTALAGFVLPALGERAALFGEYAFIRSTSNSTALPPFLGGTPGNFGFATFDYDNGIDGGEDYGLMWFSPVNPDIINAGDLFGFQDIGNLPASESADINISDITVPENTSIDVVPEPNAFGLLGALAVGLVVVRRRA
ncbi:MAG: PEP-CTERM sorting domain-containing protein, partial [Opitutales bacterium]